MIVLLRSLSDFGGRARTFSGPWAMDSALLEKIIDVGVFLHLAKN